MKIKNEKDNKNINISNVITIVSSDNLRSMWK